jgi:hypothetical protein
VEAALAQVGQAPDVQYSGIDSSALPFVHRHLADGDVYFIANRTGKAMRTEARFNVRGKAAEFWHADTGRAEPASYRTDRSATVVPLALDANESMFIVFRRAARARAVTVAMPS